MFEVLQYDFMVRALVAGGLIGIIAPLIGIFLVLRRYALIADTLSHVSLAGVAIGLLLGWNPLLTAIISSAGASLMIERLRVSKKVSGETALALFLSGSLALALVLISLSGGFNVDLFSYLFGSIITVQNTEIIIISSVVAVVLVVVGALFKQLVFISFDEEAAQVSGINTKRINSFFVLVTAVAVAVAIPIVGVLLISALMVIPIVAALQLRKGFVATLIAAEIISLCSVLTGLLVSFYLNVSPGGTIVILMLGIFLLTMLLGGRNSVKKF